MSEAQKKVSSAAASGAAAVAYVRARLTFVVDTGEKPVNFPSEAGGRAEVDTGVADEREVEVRNARLASATFSLDEHGFALYAHDSAVADYFDDDEVRAVHEKEVADLIGRATGAREVLVFDHTRRTDDAELKRRLGVRDSSRTVHNDHTPASAAQRLHDFLGAGARGRPFAIVNAWRSTSGPVLRSPLALCDARSVASSDLVATERRAKDRVGETYRLVFNATQRWWFFPEMQPREVLLIKTHDSRDDGRIRFAPHSAFDAPRTSVDAPPRQSIETRTFAFF